MKSSNTTEVYQVPRRFSVIIPLLLILLGWFICIGILSDWHNQVRVMCSYIELWIAFSLYKGERWCRCPFRVWFIDTSPSLCEFVERTTFIINCDMNNNAVMSVFNQLIEFINQSISHSAQRGKAAGRCFNINCWIPHSSLFKNLFQQFITKSGREGSP